MNKETIVQIAFGEFVKMIGGFLISPIVVACGIVAFLINVMIRLIGALIAEFSSTKLAM